MCTDDNETGIPFTRRCKNLVRRAPLAEEVPRFRGKTNLALGAGKQRFSLSPEGLEQFVGGRPSFNSNGTTGIHHKDQSDLCIGQARELTTNIQGLRGEGAFVDRDEDSSCVHALSIEDRTGWKSALALTPVQRMTLMRVRVEEFNIYRWAADFLTSLSQAKGRSEQGAGSKAL